MESKITVDANTRVSDILKAYPWLPDELITLDPAFKALRSPITKALLAKATVADVCKRFSVSADFLVDKLTSLVAQHKE